LEEFHGRHQKPREFFLQRFDAVRRHLLRPHCLTLQSSGTRINPGWRPVRAGLR
jgi:hypothetical protein